MEEESDFFQILAPSLAGLSRLVKDLLRLLDFEIFELTLCDEMIQVFYKNNLISYYLKVFIELISKFEIFTFFFLINFLASNFIFRFNLSSQAIDKGDAFFFNFLSLSRGRLSIGFDLFYQILTLF